MSGHACYDRLRTATYLLDEAPDADVARVDLLAAVERPERLVKLPNAVERQCEAVVPFRVAVVDLDAPRGVFDRAVKLAAAAVRDAPMEEDQVVALVDCERLGVALDRDVVLLLPQRVVAVFLLGLHHLLWRHGRCGFSTRRFARPPAPHVLNLHGHSWRQDAPLRDPGGS